MRKNQWLTVAGNLQRLLDVLIRATAQQDVEALDISLDTRDPPAFPVHKALHTKFYPMGSDDPRDDLQSRREDYALECGVLPEEWNSSKSFDDKLLAQLPRQVVLEQWHALQSRGVILPVYEVETRNWTTTQWIPESFPFRFTMGGLEVLTNDIVAPTPSIAMQQAQSIAAGEIGDVLPMGVLPAYREALQCLDAGYYRAAVVLVGVAVEDLVLSLFDVLAALPGDYDSELRRRVASERRGFRDRWTAAYEMLEQVREEVRRGRDPEWRGLWESIPECITGFGEAVRLARNTAAHEASHVFTFHEVALLVLGAPIHMDRIGRLVKHLRLMSEGQEA